MASTPTSRPPQISTAAGSSETTATSKRGAGSNQTHTNTMIKGQRRSSKNDHKGSPPKGPEGQQESNCEQSNVEESLLDGKESLIEIDDDYMNCEADSGSGVPLGREEQKDRSHSTGRPGGNSRPPRDKHSSNSAYGKPLSTRERLRESIDLYKEQAAKLLEAEGTIREKDEQINTLTETISRLHLRDGGVSRDDNYFTTQFSIITNSIMQWAVTYFPRSKWETISDVNGLPVELADIVKNTVCDSRKILRSTKSRRDLVNAMVINAICPFLFGPYILGSPEASNTILVVGPLLQGTDYQIQRWRALTINMFAQGPNFERWYNEQVSGATQNLGDMLTPLAPMESDADSRNTELHKIVESAAALSIEIRKQTDVIYPVPIQPGATFKADIMEDLNCEYDELEELDGKAVVQVPIFPAIMRRSYHPRGAYDEPHNLMKAKVTTMFVGE